MQKNTQHKHSYYTEHEKHWPWRSNVRYSYVTVVIVCYIELASFGQW